MVQITYNLLPHIAQFRMTRVTFGITCNPFLLAATLNKHLLSQPEVYNDICNLMKRSFYVDDCGVGRYTGRGITFV